jgi:predicted ATP-binding protein involved in virulence
MRITKISVTDLFNIFCHPIQLNLEDRITIIHGPNGFGKTTILRLLNSLFNSRYQELWVIPFSRFQVDLDNGDIVGVEKNQEKPASNITIYYKESNQTKRTFELKKREFSDELANNIANAFEDSVPGLERVGVQRWLYSPTEEVLSFSEVIRRFKERLPSSIFSQPESPAPDWLQNLRKNIHVRLIESQRLLNLDPQRSSELSRGETAMVPTVLAYSEELANFMQERFKAYGITSQSLDRTFPSRLLKHLPSSDLTSEQLRIELEKVEKTRARLIEVGLLDQEKEKDSEFQIKSQDIDESTKNALSVYVKDAEEKLKVFEEIADKMSLLKRIINNKFAYSYKEITFSKGIGFVFISNYPSLDSYVQLKDLSSGEQHELILLYELLFKVQPKSLVLIDEPELSLHVGWQVQFLKDLQEITKLADLDILIATHSPDIIQDRWDLTVELKGPKPNELEGSKH